jgi:hypothetical protein
MPANTAPIFTLTPRVSWGSTAVLTANTNKDGTGSNQISAFTAGSNGSFVQRLRLKAAGSTTSATVIRIFVNNGGSIGTAANNILFDEISVPIITLTDAAATAVYEVPLNFALPANYVIFVTTGTTITAGLYVSVVGGDY